MIPKISDTAYEFDKAYEFEASKRDGTYERVTEFDQLVDECWPTVWGWDAGPTTFEFLAKELGDIDGFSQQFNTEWEVDYEYGQDALFNEKA